jgi:hypothetical protein
MSVIYLEPGNGTIPRYPSADTIYVLESGTYISNNIIELSGSCTALVGSESGVNLFTSRQR